MIIVATIILIIILLILGILVVPFHICLNLHNDGFKIRGYFKLIWMRIQLVQREIPPQEKEKTKEEFKFDINRIPKIISLFMESWSYFERILNAFLKSTSFEKFSFNLVIGLGNPADTAMISGYLLGLASIGNVIPNAYFYVEPDFQKERLDCHLTINIKIRLFWIIIEFIRAYTKKPVRMLLQELRGVRG